MRELVVSRGGRVERDGDGWLLSHPEPGVPRLRVRFGPDGDAAIRVSDREVILVDASVVSESYPGLSWTELESIIHSVIDGGYREFVATDAGGQVAHGWELRRHGGTIGNTAYDIGVPTDDGQRERLRGGWSYSWHDHSTWPPAGS